MLRDNVQSGPGTPCLLLVPILQSKSEVLCQETIGIGRDGYGLDPKRNPKSLGRGIRKLLDKNKVVFFTEKTDDLCPCIRISWMQQTLIVAWRRMDFLS